jgi:glyoxylase I family protein
MNRVPVTFPPYGGEDTGYAVLLADPDLEAWAGWLDELGIGHSGVIDADKPVPYSVVVFRDPDNIQLEIFCQAG